MDRARWERVDNLLKSAISLPPGERDAYLAFECGADNELERELRDLVACQQEAGSFLERPALEVEAATDSIVASGRTIGHYG